MKSLGLVVLWLIGTSTAIGVAWSGVGVLDDELVAPAPAVINNDGELVLVSEAVAAAEAELAVSSDDATSATVDSSPTTPVTGDSSTTETATSVSDAPASGSSTSTTATSASTGSTASTVSSSTTSTAGSSPSSTEGEYETQTFQLIGGTTSIKFSPGYTKVLWATPNPGFDVSVEPESPGIKVEFRSDQHRSRVDAWWEDGPQHEIREEPD